MIGSTAVSQTLGKSDSAVDNISASSGSMTSVPTTRPVFKQGDHQVALMRWRPIDMLQWTRLAHGWTWEVHRRQDRIRSHVDRKVIATGLIVRRIANAKRIA